MEGDILVLTEDHLKAGKQICKYLITSIERSKGKFLVSVAGESGAGKSEVAEALARALRDKHIESYIFAQDDYFILPPKSNAAKRKQDISWVGPQEVKINLLNEEIGQIRKGNYKITKPLVIFNDDRITTETIDLANYKVLIFEGTYTSMLENIDARVFIDRTYHETKASRLKRNREKQDNFLEQILEIEHKVISKHKAKADLVITKDYNVQKQQGGENE
jgi:uridine kinase